MPGRILALDDGLFSQDALIFQPVQSRTVRYSAPGAPVLEVSWDGFLQLGLWSRPGAGFLCIEPWRGYASPASFDGEFRDKPGVFLVSPGGTVSAQYTVRVLPPEID
jgi:galactose mutarotase-like enzyme